MAAPQHAGFGLGFERLIMYLTGIANIRDVLPHPQNRWATRISKSEIASKGLTFF